jgi:hypothetical protein
VSTCPQCGATFDPARPRQRFCAPACQIQAANQRRSSTRNGRKAGAARPSKLATICQLFNQWFVRVDGWLALGPMTEALAQGHVDRMNK